ncbi:MAG: hypothetical protein ACQGVC_05900 [Myxococcota bacterium]
MPKTKGINVLEMVKFLRARRDAALELMPETLRHYLDERINVASWYPEEDMIGLVRVLVQLLPEGDEEPLVSIGRLNAHQHIEGTYKHLFESPRSATLPLRAATLWKSMHDSGEFRVVMGDGEATAEVSGYAYPTPEMCTMIRPYLEELFRASGIEKVQVDKRACCRVGASVCRYRVSWESLDT